MITAYLSSWSVVFYGESDDDKVVLLRIFHSAKSLKIVTGSADVIDLPFELTEPRGLMHADLLHCNKSEAVSVLENAHISLSLITFKKAKLGWRQKRYCSRKLKGTLCVPS